jgi:cytidylate kinase
MAVITLSREAGSGGDVIAQAVASALGYALIDKHFFERVLGQYGFIEFDRAYDSMPTFWDKVNAQKEERRVQMARLLNEAMLAVTCTGNAVILGRSGYIALRGYADVLSVRVQAPQAARVKRIAAHDGIELEEALDRLQEADRIRAAFIEEFYGENWQDTRLFDLLINTGKIHPELAAAWIATAARRLETADLHDQLVTADIEVDGVMQSAIQSELARLPAAI